MQTIITGFPFSKAIMDIDKTKTFKDMGVKPQGKIISFLDEMTFVPAARAKITEKHCVRFWEMMNECAQEFPAHTILVKPKDMNRAQEMDIGTFRQWNYARYMVENYMPNSYVLDAKKWSFIEAIGVADIVVTQGMFSSATIALICGKEGLFFDESGYKHPLKDSFKDLLVFDNKGRLFDMIGDIIDGFSPLKLVTKETLRQYNKYDNGMDRIREVICGHI